jgi:hypothetical protein
MGLDFTREQVVNALRASFDNPDHAVDILLGVRLSFLFHYCWLGLTRLCFFFFFGPSFSISPLGPSSSTTEWSSPQRTTVAESARELELAQPHARRRSRCHARPPSKHDSGARVGFSISFAKTVVSPCVHLQSMLEQQPQGQQQPVARRDSSAVPMGGMGGMGALGGLGGMGGMGSMGSMGGMGGIGGIGSSGGSGDGDGSAIEIDPAQVRAIRRMVAENPSLTGPLIESLKQTDPERAAHLTPSDPDGILRFFEELGNDDGLPSGRNGAIAPLPAPSEPRRAVSPPAAQNVGLTPAEQASVESVSCSSLCFRSSASDAPSRCLAS